MKIVGALAFFFMVAISCKQAVMPVFNQKTYEVRTFEYDSLTIPDFFSALIQNHWKDYWQFDSTAYYEFCEDYYLFPGDSMNMRNYHSIKMLHDLFTSQTSSDCSRGEILDIPYYWHWLNTNPRHKLRFTTTGELLVNTKPPQEFAQYNSYADIDRTPYLFLSDLVSETPKYYGPHCDTFSTFGWCSEREMAFVALNKLLKFNAKVMAEGAHSWSELIVPMTNLDAKSRFFRVKVDNTYNIIDWSPMKEDDVPGWEEHYGNSKFAAWYNKSASGDALDRIENHVAGKTGMQRIETKLVNYLKNKL